MRCVHVAHACVALFKRVHCNMRLSLCTLIQASKGIATACATQLQYMHKRIYVHMLTTLQVKNPIPLPPNP